MRRTFCMLKNLHAALFNEAINRKVTNSNVLIYLKFNELPFSKLPFSFFFFNSPIRKIRRLTHFMRLVPFFTPFLYTQKNKKQSGFLMFPGDVEREQQRHEKCSGNVTNRKQLFFTDCSFQFYTNIADESKTVATMEILNSDSSNTYPFRKNFAFTISK